MPLISRVIGSALLPTLYFLDSGLSSSPLEDTFHAGRVLLALPNGGALKTLVSDQPIPDGIAVSNSPRRLFWTNMGIPTLNDGTVFSSELDGSDVKPIFPAGTIHTPKQITIDHQNSKLYIGDREGLRVHRSSLNGSDAEVLIRRGDWRNADDLSDSSRWCVGVALSPSTGKFYWTQKGPSQGSQGKIFRANIDFLSGETAENRTDIELLFNNLPEPIDLDIDDDNGVLYWTDRGAIPVGNSLNRVKMEAIKPIASQYSSLPGRDYELMDRNFHDAIGLQLDLKNRHVYVTDLGGTVYRYDLDGGNRLKLYDDVGALTGITLLHS